MIPVSLFGAKTHLSRLIEQIASGAEDEIVISHNGKPVVRILPIAADASRRIGIATGEFEAPDDIRPQRRGGSFVRRQPLTMRLLLIRTSSWAHRVSEASPGARSPIRRTTST